MGWGAGNLGGGSGCGLNFKVVGNPQPTSPKENTIWVNTDVPINSWIFSATQPSPAEPGMVWIQTGIGSSVEFNALKKNSIQVYPLYAKQYISGTWVDKTAKSYQDGKWADWAFFLYEPGNQHTDDTGGWVTAKGEGMTVTFNTNHISFAVTGETSRNATVYTKNKITLSGRSELYAEVEYISGSGGVYVGISNQKSDVAPSLQGFSVAHSSVDTAGKHVVKLDMASHSGAYYVYVYSNTANAKVTRIWYA